MLKYLVVIRLNRCTPAIGRIAICQKCILNTVVETYILQYIKTIIIHRFMQPQIHGAQYYVLHDAWASYQNWIIRIMAHFNNYAPSEVESLYLYLNIQNKELYLEQNNYSIYKTSSMHVLFMAGVNCHSIYNCTVQFHSLSSSLSSGGLKVVVPVGGTSFLGHFKINM